jgi:phosphatidylglycerol:prolipoprotein diacylglycerol transferase
VLPFVFLDATKLGPFHALGIMCALGFFAWDWAVMKQGVRRGYPRPDLRAMTIWVLATGTLVAWLVDAIFYHPAERSITSTLFALQGFSSTGAIVGATIGGIAWTRISILVEAGKLRVRRRDKPLELLPLSELIVSTWPIAWALGRFGCALIHDHPGIIVAKGTFGSLFAVAWPWGPEDGVDHVLGPLHVVTGGADARFDLGLLEFFLLGAIAIGFMILWKRDLRAGTYTIVGTLVYGPIRFGLDFLRMEDGPGGDLRHAGLTFAQYWSLAVIAIGVTLLVRRWRAPEPRTEVSSTVG